MNTFRKITFAVIMVFACTCAQAAGYLKFDGVDGEAVDKDHDAWIELLHFNWGMTKKLAKGSSRRRSAPIIKDFTFVKLLDRSSPFLTDFIASGRVLPRVQVHLTRETDSGLQVYLRYRLVNASLTGYHISWDHDDRPVENITLNFEEIEMGYAPPFEGGVDDFIEWQYRLDRGK